MAGMVKWGVRLGGHRRTACPAPSGCRAHEPRGDAETLGVVAAPRGVPPVGVEPTLGTLLGGRPLPLGYGGWVMIPPWVRTILAQPNGGRKTRPGAHIQFMHSDPRMRSVTNLPGFGRNAHTA